MKLWEIIKLVNEEKISEGQQFEAIGLPIELIIEYKDGDLIYANIMGDKIERKTISCCSGEMNADFIIKQLI